MRIIQLMFHSWTVSLPSFFVRIARIAVGWVNVPCSAKDLIVRSQTHGLHVYLRNLSCVNTILSRNVIVAEHVIIILHESLHWVCLRGLLLQFRVVLLLFLLFTFNETVSAVRPK